MRSARPRRPGTDDPLPVWRKKGHWQSRSRTDAHGGKVWGYGPEVAEQGLGVAQPVSSPLERKISHYLHRVIERISSMLPAAVDAHLPSEVLARHDRVGCGGAIETHCSSPWCPLSAREAAPGATRALWRRCWPSARPRPRRPLRY